LASNQPLALYLASYPIDMCSTCFYPFHMSKMIQVRNVPDSLHRTLKARAALAGMSLSDFLLAEFRHLTERPSLAELRERLLHRSPVPGSSAAEAVRRERDAR
jgi:antitoxin FitA